MTQNDEKKPADLNYVTFMGAGVAFLVLGMLLEGAVRWVFLPVGLLLLGASAAGSLAALKAQQKKDAPGPEDVTPR